MKKISRALSTISILILFLISFGKVFGVPLTENEIQRKVESLEKEESTDKKKELENWNKLLSLVQEKKKFVELVKQREDTVKGLKVESFFVVKGFEDILAKNPENEEEYLKQLELNLETLTQRKVVLENLKATNASRIKALPTLITKLRASEVFANGEPVDNGAQIESMLTQAQYELAVAEINALESESALIEKREPLIEKALESLNEVRLRISEERDKVAKKVEEIERNSDAKLLEKISDLLATPGLKSELSGMLESTKSMLNGRYKSDGLKAKVEDAEQIAENLEASHNNIVEQYNYATGRISLMEKANLEIDSKSRLLLRRQREELPNKNELDQQLEKLIRQQAANELEIINLKASIKDMPRDPKAYAKKMHEQSVASGGDIKEQKILDVLSIFESVTEGNLDLRNEYTKRLKEAIALVEKNRKTSREYSNFLDERLLWIASHDAMNSRVFAQEWNSITKYLSPSEFKQWWGSVINSVTGYPSYWVIAILLVVAFYLMRGKFLSWAQQSHKEAREVSCQTIKPTLVGLLAELGLVMPVTLLLAILGWLVWPFCCYSDGFRGATLVYFIFTLAKRLSRKEGYLISNFKLGEQRAALIQSVAKWGIPFLLPIWVAHRVVSFHANIEPGGRLLTILALLVIALILHKLLRPSSQMFAVKGKVTMRSYLIYAVCVIPPIVLSIATVIGYFTTVLLLHEQFIFSLRLVILVLLAGAIMRRWLLVSRRRYAEKSFNEEDTEEYKAAAGNENLTDREIRKQIVSKITEVSEQSKTLITVAQVAVMVFSLLAIWANTLPALNVLDDVQLWTTAESAAKEAGSSSASSSSATSTLINPLNATKSEPEAPKGYRWVTLQNVLTMFIIFILTYIASKNIPGLLKMTILDRFNLQAGGAFAVTTAVRYTIIIVGIVWGFSSIGISWGKVQWLAAAITLGIGFGLQEIFANFVAGLIMLFERPVRIGDLVTIGGVNGRVTRIQMRATTILQFSNKELLVPNKEFITGQLVNWTLSDNVMRAEIPVGIAYGSDTQLAKKLMEKCADDNDRTLKEPAPGVIFNAFGASSLDFILRVYVAHADDLIPVQSELHFAIDDAFREAEIEIAFPQQDIHIRTIEDGLALKSVDKGSE